MATKRAKKKTPPKRWTSQDIRSVKQMAKAGTSGKAIAKALKRSVAAVYVKASSEGIVLRQKPSAGKKAKKEVTRK